MIRANRRGLEECKNRIHRDWDNDYDPSVANGIKIFNTPESRPNRPNRRCSELSSMAIPVSTWNWKSSTAKVAIPQRSHPKMAKLTWTPQESMASFQGLSRNGKQDRSSTTHRQQPPLSHNRHEWLTDINNVLSASTSAFTNITGYSREEAVVNPAVCLQSDRHAGRFYKAIGDQR